MEVVSALGLIFLFSFLGCQVIFALLRVVFGNENGAKSLTCTKVASAQNSILWPVVYSKRRFLKRSQDVLFFFFFSWAKKRESNCRQSNKSVCSTTSTIRSGRGIWFISWRILIWWCGFFITFCSNSWSFSAWNRLLVWLSEGRSQQRKTARWRCSEKFLNVKVPLYDRPSHQDLLSFSLTVLSRWFLLGVSVVRIRLIIHQWLAFCLRGES